MQDGLVVQSLSQLLERQATGLEWTLQRCGVAYLEQGREGRKRRIVGPLASQGTHDAALPALATLLQVGDPASLQGPLQACCLSLKQLRQRLHDEPVLHRAAQLDPAAAYLAREVGGGGV